MYEFYLFSLLGALGLLVLWQTFGKNKALSKLFSTLFLFAIIAYALSLFQLHLQDFYSLKILFRDLLILSFVSFASIIARKSKIGMVSWIAIAGFTWFTIFQNKAILIPKDFSLDINGELFIKYVSDGEVEDEALLSYLESENIAYSKAFSPSNVTITELDNYYSLDLYRNDPIYINKIKNKLKTFDSIELIEENEEIYLSPLVAERIDRQVPLKSFNDPLAPKQWALGALHISELEQLVENNKSIKKKAKLFILDTGVDANHEDIKSNYVSVQSKYDNDTQSHGTHCAGIAGAVTNNKKGVSSLAINNKLFTITGIKVLNDMGIGNQKKIIDGIIEASENGADVISLSLGGRSTDKRQKLYAEAVKYANDLGAIVIVAAGNSNMNAKDYSPANTPGVIAVAAIDEQLSMAPFSNSVEDLEMGIAAPGVNILSTTPNNEYKAFNGTSMATPYVSGLVALMKSYNPELSTREVYALLNESGKDIAQSRSGNLIDPHNTLKNLLK